MAKKSQRRPVRYEKDQAGCIWGLISIFDFRHGRSTRKLLSDRRHLNRQVIGAGYPRSKPQMLTNPSENSQEIDDGEERGAMISDEPYSIKARVKELMEVDMFSGQNLKKKMGSSDLEANKSNLEIKGHPRRAKRNHKRNSKTSKSFDDIPYEADSAGNIGPEKSSEGDKAVKYSKAIDMEVLHELCHQIQQNSALDVQSDQPYSVFDKKLSEAIKVFVDQRFTREGTYLVEDGKINHSKEFMEALQTLNSNKELIVELLKDSNSLLKKYIQDSEDGQLEEGQGPNSLEGSNLNGKLISDSKPSVSIVHKPHNFFRKRSKSLEKIQLKEDENFQASSRIVILKPGPPGVQNSEIKRKFGLPLPSHCNMESKVHERTASQFSFTEIKRKLKNAMGKERHGVPPNAIAHRFSLDSQNSGNFDKGIGGEKGGWSSPSRDHFYNERFTRPAIGIKNKEKISKPKDTEASIGNGPIECPEQRGASIYIEAKKHLSEMLSNGDEIQDVESSQFPLGRILSLPDFNMSPICSPGKDKEHGFVTARQRISPHDNFHVVDKDSWQPTKENNLNDMDFSNQNLNSQSCLVDNPEDRTQFCTSNSVVRDQCDHANAVERAVCPVALDMTSAGDVEIVQLTNAVAQEDIKVVDIPSESCSNSVNGDDRNSDLVELYDEQESAQCLQLDSSKQDELLSSLLASPPSISISKNVRDLKDACERPERPSPVSVLEPLFAEDDISPASTKFEPVEPPIQPLQIHFEEQLSSATTQEICISACINDEESAFEYVEAVLLASDLKWEEFLLRWISSYQILEPSLLDEVGLFSSRSRHDQKLLFDCTNEVLREACDRYFRFSPWMSSAKHNIRPVPRGKDLIEEIWERVEWHLLPQPSPRTLDVTVRKDMKAEIWMDLHYDVEYIGTDIGRAILEELVQDTILSFEHEGSETAPAPPAESLEC